jgi:hypothetical protein
VVRANLNADYDSNTSLSLETFMTWGSVIGCDQMFLAVLAVFSCGLSYSQTPSPPIKIYSAHDLLKNYALSACLHQASPESPIGNDARASAAAYVELGRVNDSDAYLDINQMAKDWLSKAYTSKTGSTLTVMKCIDFYHSKELTQKVKRYTKGV